MSKLITSLSSKHLEFYSGAEFHSLDFDENKKLKRNIITKIFELYRERLLRLNLIIEDAKHK